MKKDAWTVARKTEKLILRFKLNLDGSGKARFRDRVLAFFLIIC